MAEARCERRRVWRVLFWLTAAVAAMFAAWRFLMPANPEEATVAASADGNRQVNPTTAFEPSDWDLRPIAAIYVGLLVLLVISAFVLIAAYPDALSDVDRTPRVVPPAPRLQTDGAADLRRFRADEDRRLNTYSWIDKQKGIVRIPIEQAMKTLAQTGAPGFPKAQQ
jgi:hypothetical protein